MLGLSVTAKSTPRRTDDAVTIADRSRLTDAAANVTTHDIARRAYDFYLARGREHGHDVDDWLQAERDLRGTRSSSAM
jgi:hypothetical protein